jgi:hypothetical protein
VVATSTAAVELQVQLLAREKELDSRKGAIAAWEDGLTAFVHALVGVCTKYDDRCVQAEVVQQDFLAQRTASSSWFKQLHHLSWMSGERQIFLCLQERDLEVQEVILVEQQACVLHPFDGQDLSMELEEIRVHVDGIASERAVEAEQLSQLVVGISNALVDLGVLPVLDIPQFLKSA